MTAQPPDRLVTRAQLAADLASLGVAEGATVMVHASLSGLGWVVGGAPTVIRALLDVVGPQGNLLALTSWDDGPPYHQQDWTEQERAIWRDHCPPFDPLTSRSYGEVGRLPEALRTWPGARHSYHPDCAFAALGPDAGWLTEGQRFEYGYGDESPLDRLVQRGGWVLQLAAPPDTITLYHLAEYRAAAPDEARRWNTHEMPVMVGGERVFRVFRELDSSRGAFDYGALGLDVDAFAAITAEAIEAGLCRQGPVGRGVGRLFAAPGLLDFAVGWLNARFGPR